MKEIDRTISIDIGGMKKDFRLRKPDAFSGVEILRLLMRLQDQKPEANPSIYDLIISFSVEEMKSVMKSCLNNVYVILPAGPNPIMTGSEWSYPELEHDTQVCMKLLLEEISWTLDGFFVEGGSSSAPAGQNISQQNA